MFIPVVMAGGIGSRLWPLSRELYPKQFICLHGQLSMLQETIERLNDIESGPPLVICNEEHRFLVAEQLRQIGKLSSNIILEPVGRNTAPAIALTALHAIRNGDDPLLLILAADHVIENSSAFSQAINTAIPIADQGRLVTFGIVPNRPETGYGYIHRSTEYSSNASYIVDGFVEKPSLEVAKEYLSTGEYYWNSGIFMFRAKKYLEELRKFRPDIFDACQRTVETIKVNGDFFNFELTNFLNCPAESVDYAVMEKTDAAIVVPLDAGWNDVGSWSALWEISNKDSNGNSIEGDVLINNTEGCYINSEHQLVAAIGLKNTVIVNTKDAVLVANKDDVQNVKEIVDTLKKKSRREYRRHRETYWPWGRSDMLIQTERFNVNRLTIKPGGSFPIQMHYHRTEHWIVLSGTAKVTIQDKELLLTENQSTFIPIGSWHTLENPGKIPLEILEIQSGSYLGDNDFIQI
ncbi:mannose-1-phosphate guanylyltransferase/mannose-6-phosphate isomerase [Dickeya zeae]|uniref:mannose-1-phosphate guanylyltransferase n=1 Tax=Dickeya zeae TaxID=204042 RepID=A0ABX8VWL2_9GAMM|nr:mannose-1-phosphate guanylyltransferase/mannose-6-phosphate isomerase [Dickeya zeae]QYM92308.1 mannose-1-phosphate guanylyltransferase/mannose-6-phosphate isomerase [Dickeya zeae]